MASDYGLNFGFRRSDESLVQRESRFKVPATGTWRLGMLVTIDPAEAGFLKAAAADEIGDGAFVGLLVQEEIWDRSMYGPQRIDSFYYGVARNGRLANIIAGPGTKVWFRNTAAETRADGRVIAAVTMGTFTALVVGDYLKWDGTKWVEGTSANSMLRVVAVEGTTYVEATLIH